MVGRARLRALPLLVALAAGLLLLVPAAARADFTVQEGQPFSGKVVDIGGANSCALTGTASIDWGDGTTTAGASDGISGITGSHPYTHFRTANGVVTYQRFFGNGPSPTPRPSRRPFGTRRSPVPASP